MKVRKVSVAYFFYHKIKEFCSYFLPLQPPNKKITLCPFPHSQNKEIVVGKPSLCANCRHQ